MAAVVRSLDTTFAVVTYVCDCVTAAIVGRDAVRYVVRDSRLIVARPDVGELCVARKPCWKGRCVTLSRGLRPVDDSNAHAPCHVLDISANDGDNVATQFATPLAASMDEVLRATASEVLALMSAVAGRECTSPLIVTYEDFTQSVFREQDPVILVRRRPPQVCLPAESVTWGST